MMTSLRRGRRVHAHAAPQGGQAVTEFLVLCLALVPLFLLLPMIAKYQDVAHAAQMASRYVAFDAMARNEAMSTWKPEAQLAAEVRRRFFSNADAWVKTNDTAGDFAANQNLFWRDPAGGPLITKFDRDVVVSFGSARGAAHADGMSAASDGVPFRPIASEMGLAANGIYTVNVGVTLANLPAGLKSLEPFDAINLTMHRHTSVVIDPWVADSPARVEERIDHALIFPGTSVSATVPVIGAAVTVFEVGQVPAPRPAQLSLWRDVVPADRRVAH